VGEAVKELPLQS